MSTSPELTPKNTGYLRSDLIYNQLQTNYKELTLSTGIAADPLPQVWLDGTSRAQLQGQVTINTSSVAASMPLCTLPINLTLVKDVSCPIVVERAGAYVPNAIAISHGGSSIASFTITNGGDYTAIPTVTLTGNGHGATFTKTMKAISTSAINTAWSSGNYAPGDLLTLVGGTSTQAAVFPVATTRVVVVTGGDPGTGGTNGAQVVTGTTGTGTKFSVNVTITAGSISAIGSIVTPGSYTVNPSNLAGEPVTGANLTGATLVLTMGVNSLAAPSVPGSYTVLPSNPVSTTSNGSGVGANIQAHWAFLGLPVTAGGEDYDNTSAVVFDTGTASASINLGPSTEGLVSLMTAPQQNDIVHLDNVIFYTNSYSY